jgi:hypothetical protein
MMKSRLLVRIAAGPLLGMALAAAAVARPPAGVDTQPAEIRVLLDNSGSMYPGYAPAGYHGTPKSQSGAKFYYEYPEFRQWLSDFVARQEILGGKFVSLSAFTDGGTFKQSDLQEIHPRVPLGEFDAERIVPALHRLGWGQYTFLSQNLEHYARGFDGLLWIITDNFVETRRGTPDQDVVAFFRVLKEGKAYQSVHLFKLPFADPRTRTQGALAVYGLRVAQRPLPREALARFDMTMRSRFLPAARRTGSPRADLFPGREHLKLKELSIDALELTTPPIKLWIENREGDVAEENDKVSLELRGEIHSYLTQHSVIRGYYTLTPLNPFVPEAWAANELGVQPIAPQSFAVVSTPLRTVLPPNGVQAIRESIPSRSEIRISTRGLWAWARTAFRGAVIDYTGTALVSFSGIKVKLERSHMAGIFGIDKASPIFDIQDVQALQVPPTTAPLHLALHTSSRRTALLAFVLLALGLPLAAAAWLLGRRELYRVRIGEQPPSVEALRRLQGRNVFFQGLRLGRLRRGLEGRARFAPEQDSAAVSVVPARSSAAYDVRLRGGETFKLTIEPLRGGAPVAQDRARIRPPFPVAPGHGDRGPEPRPPATPGAAAGAAPRARPQIRRP